MVVLDDASPNASTLSWTSELNLAPDPGNLSPRSRSTYWAIWVLVQEGIKPTEIANKLGRAPSYVSDELKAFYTEVCFQQGIFPPLADEEYEALKDSIAERGVEVPIVVDEHGEIIDGRMRRHIARELGIDCPFEVRHGLSLAERRDLAITLNGPRRHMNRQQKTALVVSELMIGRDRSDRAIGRLVGTSHVTVGKVRRELEDEEELWAKAEGVVEGGQPDQPLAQNDPAVTERFQGHVECPCCSERLELWRRGGEWMLDQPLLADAA